MVDHLQPAGLSRTRHPANIAAFNTDQLYFVDSHPVLIVQIHVDDLAIITRIETGQDLLKRLDLASPNLFVKPSPILIVTPAGTGEPQRQNDGQQITAPLSQRPLPVMVGETQPTLAGRMLVSRIFHESHSAKDNMNEA
ncbi:hypothetical protein [Porticoccus sp.]|uniref:hypothetical protein n=1 Tax=Porticoccus sp. TaxID=2024853 RepID=UPI003F6A30B3